eukprot:ANDGO_00198.mRNA.1 AP-2 complex subunit alpha-1
MSNLEMRGLTMFISDIRNCRTKDLEQKRINKELAKVRQKFKEDTKMTGYDRKKYIAKLLYIFMLGYNVDFGHIEAVRLLSSDKYSEKHLGYLACTLLLDETHELLTLIINSVAQDLLSNNENFQCLALTAIANVGGKQFAEALCGEVIKVLTERETKTPAVKKAALTLLRLYRKYPEVFPPDEWCQKVVGLLDRPDLGVLTSVASLLVGLVSDHPDAYEGAVPRSVRVLVKIVLQKDYSSDYVYYGVPTPWLQVKLLRLLQYYPPPADQTLQARINEVLTRIIGGSEIVPKAPNKTNAIHAVLYEAIALVIAYNNNPELLTQAVTILSRYLVVKDANLKYLALESLARVATHEAMKKQQETVVASLKDADISIRRRALEVLYCLCDASNAEDIVRELLEYLQVADFAIREDLVLRIALLAEKFAPSPGWFLDTCMKLLHTAGDYVTDDVWFRVAQIVTNTPDIHAYAAEQVLKEVRNPAAHETAIKIGAYILGEYGRSLDVSGADVFDALHAKYVTVSAKTQALLLNSYVKLRASFASDGALRDRVSRVFTQMQSSMDPEVQQRACEYSYMLEAGQGFYASVLEELPAFPERESSILRQLKQKEQDTVDKSVWTKKQEQENAAGEEGEQQEEQQPEVERAAPLRSASQQQQKKSEPLDSLLDLGNSEPISSSGSKSSGNAGDILDLLSGPSAAPSHSASSSSSGGLSAASLFGGPVAAQSAQHAAPAPSALDDIFGGPVNVSTAASASSVDINTVGSNNCNVSPEAIKASARNLAIQDRGVLFEDERVQVGCVAQFAGAAAQVGLFFGNKASAPLTQLSIQVHSSDPNALRIQTSALPPMVTPRQQAQATVQAQMSAPFEEAPHAVISYNLGAQSFTAVVSLPILVTKFFAPMQAANSEQFFGRWRSIVGDGTEQQEAFKSSRPVDVQNVQRILGNGLRFSTLSGIDPNPANAVAAASYGQVPVMVRVETNAQSNAYRVTVRASSAPLARATLQIVKAQLA